MASIHEIILAGLLHDIGKFYQRASQPGVNISPETDTLRGYVCPTSDKGYSTHLHALYTREFCDRYLDALPSAVRASTVARLASCHHRPSPDDEALIAEADRLSSAMDRLPDDQEDVHGRTAFRRVRLRAVARAVDIGKGAGDAAWVHELKPLAPDVARPIRADDSRLDPADGADLTQAYANLWDAFVEEWAANACPDPWGYICRALSVLERFTWCIPSATNVLPDISLADHLKTTAAIAGCLCAPGAPEKEPFMLVAGDFGGIQSYIFDIRSGAGGLARRLRSRSFFVSILSDVVAHRLLRRLDLPLTNCIMAAGGRFHLLLPNTQPARDAVDAVRSETDRWARRETNGEVHVHLAAAAITKEDLRDFAAALQKVRAALYDEKRRPARSVLQTRDGWDEDAFLLDRLDEPDEGGLCDSCQKRWGGLEEVHGRQVPVCPSCREDRDLGRVLPKTRFVCFYDDDTGRRCAPGGSIALAAGDAKRLPGRPYLVLDLDGGCAGPADWPLAGHWRARRIPIHLHGDEAGNAVTFEELAAEATGRETLAYLKADVDNLGLIFAQGLGKPDGGADKRSISRIATLSRSLEIFFSGRFEQLLRTDFPKVYTIYAGGDDVLCAGPWDQMVELADTLRREFRAYTCENPNWTLSAGLVVVTPKTPVLVATSEAEARLDGSKHAPGDGVEPYPLSSHDGDAARKDRFTLFGSSIPWAMFPDVFNTARRLWRWLDSGLLTTGQVRRLLQYADMHRQFQRTGDTLYLRWIPHLVYDLKRNWRGGSPEAREAKQWANSLAHPHNPDMNALTFACHYALYSVRGRERSGND